MKAWVFIKWGVISGLGVLGLCAALLCYTHGLFAWVLAAAFTGFFLASAGIKKLILFRKAQKALAAGKAAVKIQYRDHNLKEYEIAVIPAGCDSLYFYGFSCEKNDIKALRWSRIIRAAAGREELSQKDIIRLIEG
jgi:hypothetical protein